MRITALPYGRGLTALASALLLIAAGAGESRASPDLVQTDAFEMSYAASFYSLDACGDGLAGQLYRRALLEKFKHCPFSAAARAHFLHRSTVEREKASDAIKAMIEQRGGMPMHLDGMAMTCHGQHTDADYQAFRGKLDQYGQGAVSADTIIPQPCDAAEIAP
jgi:hypothetical protein